MEGSGAKTEDKDLGMYLNIENYARPYEIVDSKGECLDGACRQFSGHRNWYLQTTYSSDSEWVLIEEHVSSWVLSVWDAIYSSDLMHNSHHKVHFFLVTECNMTVLWLILNPMPET